MRPIIQYLIAAPLCGFLASCSLQSGGGGLAPALGTGTADVQLKQTQAEELTAHPATPLPTELAVLPTYAWTPMAGEIVAGDSGKTYDIGVTDRISVILKQSDYPQQNLVLSCTPAAVLGSVSNIPVVPPGYYVVRYEAVQLGTCTLKNGVFTVKIEVVSQP